MGKIRLALMYGGKSGEHSISCATAAGVLKALDPEKYDVMTIGVTKAGKWVPGATDPAELALNADATTQVPDSDIELVLGYDGVFHQIGGAGYKCLGKFDLVFPLLHGPFGEDGTIQGLFELYGVRYVGAGLAASALGMDKHLTKMVLRQAGLPVTEHVLITPAKWETEREKLVRDCEHLGLPVFVKPSRAGSSLGVTKVTSWDQLESAIIKAAKEDPKILVEKAVAGTEVEVAVLGPAIDDLQRRPRTALPGRLVFDAPLDFYDFSTKYVQSTPMHLEIPAQVPDGCLDKLRDFAARAFSALECEGLSRVDFFVNQQTGQITINEINTMPGFTPFSMYPQAWAATGLSYSALLDELIEIALQRPVGLR